MAVITKISSLVKQGATVIGSRPVMDSGLKNYPQCDDAVKVIAGKLWGKTDQNHIRVNNYGKGRVFAEGSIRDILMNDGIQPDFEYTGQDEDFIDFIHRSTPEAEIYFIANRHGRPVLSDCTFRVKDRVPEIWDPVQGTIRQKVNFRNVNGRIEISLQFEAFQSWFVVFPKRSTAARVTAANFPVLTSFKELKGSWKVAFDTKWGGPETVVFDRLRTGAGTAMTGSNIFRGKPVIPGPSIMMGL